MNMKCKILLFLNFTFGFCLLGNQGNTWINSDLNELEKNARDGDPYAQGFLALCHIHGDKELNISFDSANYWAKMSADSNHWLGLFAIGYLHRFPPLGPDPQKVSNYYNQVFSDPDGRLVKNAGLGDPVASYVIGEIFTAEELEPKLSPDIEFAAKHYALSSRGGYSAGSVQHALLKIHANSIVSDSLDIGKDVETGIELLKQTAKLNLPSAHHFLGHSYFKGTGVEKDYQMALIHFQAAADRGYSTSQLIVAHFYAYGLTGPAKIDIALRYANLALEQEREKAVEKIAEYENLLSKSQPIPPVKPVDSVDLDIPSPDSSSLLPPPLPPSPQQGLNPPEDSLSENNRLPPIYQTAPLDNSIKSDNEITKQESASKVESALVSEKLELAKKHYFGREMKLDLNLAFKLFSELSMTGNAEAARYLGIMYLRGKGVDKNQNEALNWFEKAAAGGDELAKRNLKTLKMLVNKN